MLGNVHIQLSTENNSEFITKNRGKRNANPGVYLMYPGLSKPWMARVSKKTIGNFASEEEATSARNAYLAARPQSKRAGGHRLGTGRGYCLCGDKFKVVVARRYIGLFATADEAVAARQSAISQMTVGA